MLTFKQGCGVKSWSFPFEGLHSGHVPVLLLDCTLSIILNSFGRCTGLAGCTTSSTSCHATLLMHI